MKLSPTQAKVIEHLQTGGFIHWMDGFNAKCFYDGRGKTISWATVFKLENLGLVQRLNGYIKLTEQGLNHKLP